MSEPHELEERVNRMATMVDSRISDTVGKIMPAGTYPVHHVAKEDLAPIWFTLRQLIEIQLIALRLSHTAPQEK